MKSLFLKIIAAGFLLTALMSSTTCEVNTQPEDYTPIPTFNLNIYWYLNDDYYLSGACAAQMFIDYFAHYDGTHNGVYYPSIQQNWNSSRLNERKIPKMDYIDGQIGDQFKPIDLAYGINQFMSSINQNFAKEYSYYSTENLNNYLANLVGQGQPMIIFVNDPQVGYSHAVIYGYHTSDNSYDPQKIDYVYYYNSLLNMERKIAYSTFKTYCKIGDYFSFVTVNQSTSYSYQNLGNNITFSGSYGIFTETTNHRNSGIIPYDVTAKLFSWNNTLGISEVAPGENGEGLTCWKYTVIGNQYSWFGAGVSTSNTVNLSSFNGGALVLRAKSSDNTKFRIGMESSNATYGKQGTWVKVANYGFINDGLWHTMVIPLSELKMINPKLDLAAIKHYFMVSHDGTYTVGDSFYIDDVYLITKQ